MTRLSITVEDGGHVEYLFEDVLDPVESDVFLKGFQDGKDSPDDLEGGITFDKPHLNEVYDTGVNLGQAVTRYERTRG
jgi:hypothetical protein